MLLLSMFGHVGQYMYSLNHMYQMFPFVSCFYFVFCSFPGTYFVNIKPIKTIERKKRYSSLGKRVILTAFTLPSQDRSHRD